MKCIIKHATLYIAVTCMFLTTSFCMDIIGIGMTNKAFALSVVLQHGIAHFNYRDPSCLAVNKETERMLHNFSEGIKKHVTHLINQQYPCWSSGKKILWYKYGTACSVVDSRYLITTYSLWEDQNITRQFFDEHVKEYNPCLVSMSMNYNGEGKFFIFVASKCQPKKKARIKSALEKLKIKK